MNNPCSVGIFRGKIWFVKFQNTSGFIHILTNPIHLMIPQAAMNAVDHFFAKITNTAIFHHSANFLKNQTPFDYHS